MALLALLLKYLLFMDFGGTTSIDYTINHCFVRNTQCNLPLCNRVYHENLPSSTDIEHIKNYFGNLLFTWVVAEDDHLTAQILEDNELNYKINLTMMNINLDNLKSYDCPSDITIKTISQAELPLWFSILAEGFNYPLAEIKQTINYILAHDTHESITLYLGFFKEIPVATSLIVRHPNLITVHMVSTLPLYRNKGVGRSITHKLLYDAKEQGFQQALLLASPMGKPMYEEVGFKKIIDYKIYGNF